MLPSITFSRPCRSTLNGVCAACGKLGALLGSAIFLPLASRLGNAEVMLLCAAVSVAAAIMTFVFTDEEVMLEPTSEEDDDGKEVPRISSEAHLAYLIQEERKESSRSRGLPRIISMPNFLDLE